MQARLLRQMECNLGEGPIWAFDRLFFFDITACDVHSLSADGSDLQSWHIGRMGSAAARTDGTELLVATETDLVMFDPETDASRTLVPLEEDNPANRSNDGRADRQGGFWIGTMGKNAEHEAGAIYRYHDGELRCLRRGVSIPNAICFSPDGQIAYFADTALNTIFEWRLGPDGWPIGAPTVFHQMPQEFGSPDGAVIDADGNMWLAVWGGGRILRITPDGIARELVDLPVPQPTCPAFGPDGALYITSARQGLSDDDLAKAPLSGSVFITSLTVDGLEEPEVILP